MINIIYFSLFFLFFLDIFFKEFSLKHIKNQEPICFFNKKIQILCVFNYGIAFNFLSNRKKLILFINFSLFLYLIYLFIENPNLKFPLSLILCGGLGNFVERIYRGFVVDYIYFNIKKMPVFNLSDFYILFGIINLLFLGEL